MAKKFITIGNVAKSQKDGSRYVKVNMHPGDGTNITLKQGDYINIKPFEEELARLKALVADGKMKPETLEKIEARFTKDKEFGAFAIAVVSQDA